MLNNVCWIIFVGDREVITYIDYMYIIIIIILICIIYIYIYNNHIINSCMLSIDIISITYTHIPI